MAIINDDQSINAQPSKSVWVNYRRIKQCLTIIFVLYLMNLNKLSTKPI